MNEKKSLILMVEDEEQVLNTNCRMLRRRGYDVRTAQTAAEACHQLEEQLPDLLILDIMLPDGNGLDICRRFREKTMNPVLFLTGKSDIRDRVEGLQQGGDYYLTKPYNFDEFLAVIQMLLERQKRMEEKIKEKFLNKSFLSFAFIGAFNTIFYNNTIQKGGIQAEAHHNVYSTFHKLKIII